MQETEAEELTDQIRVSQMEQSLSDEVNPKLMQFFDADKMCIRDRVNIVASYFFGGISGSASADTASIGSIMIPMMVDQGYDAAVSYTHLDVYKRQALR